VKANNERMNSDGLTTAASIAVAMVVAVGLLILLISFRGRLEEAMSNLASLLPVGYAFAAGMVASVNPCGALMLPSYIFFQLGAGDGPGDRSALEQAFKGLRIALVATAGFAVVFGVAGLVVTAGGRWLASIFPFAGLIIGVAMVVLGTWLLVTHRSLGILAASRVAVTPARSLWNVFLFGIAYALSSLSCALPIFLVVIGSALSSGDQLLSFVQFIGYALGMGAVLAFVAIGTALFQQALERWLRRLIPYVHRLGAMFLVGAGLYLVYYWVSQGRLLG
jgi:cytochrome c biogenesis protein CcdA